ncbi:hypothetical protein [Lentzea terrae]|uniref:hypothetical protein n=1 Tax=Lentzea terrae TaxID=2200761 RepID=UPI000DD4AAC9|nr:hypothetical protein [Lentzea terrae]
MAYVFLLSDTKSIGTTFALAGGFAAVIALDLAAIAVLGIAMRWVKMTYAWVLVRVLGVLLAALGVDQIIEGLI